MTQNPAIDEIDREIILATQGGLPLVPKPYDHVAEQVNISPDEVMSRMNVMLEKGIIIPFSIQ